jgi:hypothetical protein
MERRTRGVVFVTGADFAHVFGAQPEPPTGELEQRAKCFDAVDAGLGDERYGVCGAPGYADPDGC